MKSLLSFLILLVGFGCQSKGKSTHVVKETPNPRYLFVLSANEGTFDKKELTLIGVPSVIYFSDRPARVAGHVNLQQFTQIWDKQRNSQTGNLSLLQDNTDQDVVLELKTLSVKGGNLSFSVEAVQGEVPKTFKQSALFIDIESIKEDLFAFGKCHPLDCSCASIAEGSLESVSE